MPQTRAHSRAGGEDGPASRLSTSRRKSIPKFIDDPPPTAPVGSEDENLESNLLALKRCRHKLNIYAGGAKRYFMSWSGNRDGQLDREELRKGFDAMNLGFDQNQVNFLVRAFDADKSNSVDFSEFCKTMELTDSELVSTVCHESMNAQPKWMLPEKWHFTSQDTGKIDKLKLDLQNRLHLNYGSDPMAMRRAFLVMDRQRCGMVTRGDLIHSFAALGLQVPDKDVEMFMSAMCDKKEEGGIRYRSFLKYFEPGPVGSFNPFRPELPIDGSRPGAAKTSAEDVEEVKDVWQGCFGRDSRYRVVFPHLYGGAIRTTVTPQDFSGNRDTAHFYDWREQGKIVGGNLNRMPAKRPLPTRGFGMSGPSSPAGAAHSANPPGRILLSPEEEALRAHQPKDREELVREREERFQTRRSQVLSMPRNGTPLPASAGGRPDLFTTR